MKLLATFFITALFAAASAEAKPLQVFILAGQSNMQGQGIVSSLAEMKVEKPGTLASMLKDPAKAPLLKTWVGIQALLVICGVVAVLGLICSWLLVPKYNPLDDNGEIARRYEMFQQKICSLEAGEEHTMSSNERSRILGPDQGSSYI